MIAGAYDYIEECRDLYGDDYVDNLLDGGYEPVCVVDANGDKAPKWVWLLKSANRVTTVN